jgi:signal transduction histidine kinase
VTQVEEPLEGLLRRVLSRVEEVVAAESRVRSLLDAVTAIAGTLDVRQTLERIVAAAADLAGARYVALGVIDQEGEGLSEFITYGINEEDAATIGPLPAGHGILGLLISEPQPLRLHDLRQHPKSYGFPEHHPPMSSFLGVPLRVGDRIFGNLYLTDKHGAGDFTDEDELAVVALAAAAGVAVENARLFTTVRRREQWLDATLTIQQAFLRRVDLATALHLVSAKAREVLDADVGVVVLEHDDGTLRVFAVDGEGDVLDSTLPREGALADVVEHGATVRLAEGLRIPGLDSVASALLVPFTGPGDHGGALLVGTNTARRGRWLAEDDVQALQGFAAQAAIAMDRAQAQQDRAALAVLADRDRIARDLHDVVIQRLFATGLMLQSTVRRVSDADVVERLTGAVADLDTTIRDIRGTIFELSASNRADDLRDQLREVVADAHASLSLRPHLVLEGALDSLVSDELRPDLIAVLVESLSNAARHASPTHIEVRVAIEDADGGSRVMLEVSDDGKGCAAPSRENGLRNMRNRARDHGGGFEFVSAEGAGATVRWWVPLETRGVPGAGT